MFGRCAAAILSVILIILIACPGVLGADYIPLLPDDLCIPDKTGIEITPPVLQQAGSPLIVSNSPEVVRLDSGAVALYRTSVHAAHFRVFLHHENLSGRTLKIGFAITNPSTASSSIEVYLGRNSQGLPFACQSTVSSSPITAGSLALKQLVWLAAFGQLSLHAATRQDALHPAGRADRSDGDWNVRHRPQEQDRQPGDVTQSFCHDRCVRQSSVGSDRAAGASA